MCHACLLYTSVNENVKAANSCLRKAKWQAKELAVFTGEVVRLMDKEDVYKRQIQYTCFTSPVDTDEKIYMFVQCRYF